MSKVTRNKRTVSRMNLAERNRILARTVLKQNERIRELQAMGTETQSGFINACSAAGFWISSMRDDQVIIYSPRKKKAALVSNFAFEKDIEGIRNSLESRV